jgi:hypothetical protein
MAPELTRRDRRMAAQRLGQLADELDAIGSWLDRAGGDADKASLLTEAAARDLRAAAWVVQPADHERLGLGWESVTEGRLSG